MKTPWLRLSLVWLALFLSHEGLSRAAEPEKSTPPVPGDSGVGLQSAREARLMWTEPGVSSADSVPLGNGDIGMNVWNEADGSISFYISKTDAWDGKAELVKVGKLRLQLTPTPLPTMPSLNSDRTRAASR